VWTATALCSEADGDSDARAETAVTQLVIDAQPAGAHGESQDLLILVVSQGPDGISDDASPIVPAFEACACALVWLACVVRPAAGASITPAIDWSPCIRHSVPLLTSESWSSNALESTAAMR